LNEERRTSLPSRSPSVKSGAGLPTSACALGSATAAAFAAPVVCALPAAAGEVVADVVELDGSLL
jgi:hypothetical protein